MCNTLTVEWTQRESNPDRFSIVQISSLNQLRRHDLVTTNVTNHNLYHKLSVITC